MANKQFRENRNGKALYYDKDAIWYQIYGTLKENGYNEDSGISKVFKKSSGEKEIQYFKKNKEYKIVDQRTDDKGNTWLITFMDITNDRRDTVSFQLGDLYEKGGMTDCGCWHYEIGGL